MIGGRGDPLRPIELERYLQNFSQLGNIEIFTPIMPGVITEP